MKAKTNTISGLNILRIFLCVAVFLYHLGILKGGYLAVCIFLVLTGYLSCKSAIKNSDFSIKDYYKKKFIRIYIPVLIITLLSIAAVFTFCDTSWINLKKETLSVLLGYNNFWQLNANLDYFTRHIESPFMHLWYISITIQYYLLFPFIYKLLNLLNKKVSKYLVPSLLIFLSIISYVYFILTCKNNIMVAYYNTLSRSFSILLGMSIAFITCGKHFIISNYLKKRDKIIKDNKFNKEKIIKLILLGYYLILIVLFIFVPADSKFMTLSMLLSTFIGLRIIEYSTKITNKNKISKFMLFIKKASDITYEIYLVQYPVIFIFQGIEINYYLKLFFIILITVILSIIIHISLNTKVKWLKWIMCIIISFGCIYGGFLYINSKDYSKEMEELENQLKVNSEMLEKGREDYLINLNKEKQEWEDILNNYESESETLKDGVKNLPVVYIGDSVMLGAAPTLKNHFPNSYIDAAISRTAWVVSPILEDLKNRGALEGPIVLHLGTNGDCESCRENIMNICDGKDVFWINTTADGLLYFNDIIDEFANNYENLHVIDWYTYSRNHPEYFVPDGIHLTPTGSEAYTNLIYDNLYEYYDSLVQKKKQEAIDKHNDDMNKKITFFGDDLLINSYQYLKDDYLTSNFTLKENISYMDIIDTIDNLIENNELSNRVVFAFDNKTNITYEEYKNIIDKLENHELYILKNNNNQEFIDKLNVNVIDTYSDMCSDEKYVLSDKIHFNSIGSEYFAKQIHSILNIAE